MPAHPSWVTTTMTTLPVVPATEGHHFTTGSRLSMGHDDQDAPTAGLRINDWFLAHPECVLGHLGMVRQHGMLWQLVSPPSDVSVATLLTERLHLPQDLFQARQRTQTAEVTPPPPSREPAKSARVQALLRVYAAAKAVLRADAAGEDAQPLRATLQATYADLVQHYGVIHTRANQQALKGQPELCFLRALETNVRVDDGIVCADQAVCFTQPTLRPTPQIAIGQMTADEALVRCLNDVGQVDLPTITRYTGMDTAAVIAALQGRIYHDPALDRWVTADHYLAGNVRRKLAEATAAATRDPRYQANIEGLHAVQPTPLTPGQIKATIGAPWIPASDVRDFITSLIPRFGDTRYGRRSEVIYHAPLAKWVIRDPNRAMDAPEATTVWGTARMDAISIIQNALNGIPCVVYDVIRTGESEKRVPNQPETLLAQSKQQAIATRFSQWVWEDADRADRLCTIYNDTFNTMRRRDVDGSHLLLPGINRSILRGGDLLPHQKDAVWCALQQPATLLDLCVGAGKTFIGLVWAHEVKRLGLARKVLITAPNHLVEQWGVEANRLYPDMRVLVMAPEDFTKAKRGEFLSRIATESFDVVICAHTSFGFIEPGTCASEFIAQEVTKLRDYLLHLRRDPATAQAEKRSLKQIEDRVDKLETRLKEIRHTITHDSARTITWDELGIDALVVDEAHEYKNLPIASMMNVPGVPKGDAKRAFDMRIKTWDILRRGGKVVFATGTPILNSVGEAFIMQTFLSEGLLEERGIAMFDAWARTFAEVVPVFEMTPDGGGFRLNSRLARFVNLPELFSLWYQVTFSRSREQLGLPTPTLMSGKRQGITIPPSPQLTAYVQQCVRRVEAIKTGRVQPWEDNVLKVVSDASKAALDIRLVAVEAPMPPLDAPDLTEEA